jgi:SAM-dependent methyltransferase
VSDWYTRIFNADYLRSYSWQEEGTPAQVEELAALLDLPRGARILDLAGGFGRIAVPLAQRGYALTVLDLSQDFLEVGRRRAAEAGVDVRWLHADMRSVPPSGDFDAVINVFSSFGYFDADEEDERVLRGAFGALKPGGVLLLEMINRELVVRSGDPFWHWTEGPDSLTLDQSTFDVVAGRSHTRRTFHDLRSGERKDYSFSVRLYTPPEVARMLARAGFVEVAFQGDLRGAPLTREARRMVVLARKRHAG